jgi:1,4-alpha-glucan branching enzyme
MKKFFSVFTFLVFSTLFSESQVLRWSPSFIQESNQTITITCNAKSGNKGLLEYAPVTDVFVHIGAITNLSTGSSDWKYAPFTWATTNALANASNTAPNEWTFTISGGLRAFFKITNPNEKIIKIAVLFRSGNGSKAVRNENGSDMYIPVYDNGLYARIDEPFTNPTYIPSLITVNKNIGDNFSILGNASQSANLIISHNGMVLKTEANKATISANTTINKVGTQKFLFEASTGSSISKDSVSFFVTGPANISSLPIGSVDGINYEQGDTSVVLVLYAPGKSGISVVGDFNNWTETTEEQMNKTPDGNRFWIRLKGLKAGQEYAYQYIIDGGLRVADYNTEKILDPNNDGFIPAITYPNLKPYPTSKTTGIVSVLQTGKPQYTWKVKNFSRPDRRNLVIYEVLIRDFLATRNFQSLKDTIPYLKRLGINAIELMPFSEFEGNLSWGYNPNFFFAPDKFYGTEMAIKEFIDACHQQGIAVIIDMVLNHCFGSSPLAQMYWDGANNQPSANNPWLNVTATHPYNVGNDFNHESAATKDFVSRVVRHWLTKYNIDGIRWDLSKGFTQTNNANNVAAWSNYDAGRIATWKRIYDTMQSVSQNSYCILEHFADNTEEKELAEYGMLLWGNANNNFNQATMGYNTDADFSGISSEKRGWNTRHLVGYMESHDEERLMFKNIMYGNQSGSYNVKDSITGLKRNGMAAAFWALMPGPKMLWQFGELGFPYSINTCANGTVNSTCRLDNKVPVWESYFHPFKRGLYDVYSNLLRLRTKPNYLSTFTTNKFTTNFGSLYKSLQINDDSLKIVVVGNFDVVAKSNIVNFPSDGTWFSYLTGTNINIAGGSSNISLQPGEYHVYLNKDLSANIITNINITTFPTLEANLSIFPNPLKSYATVSFTLEKAGKTELELIDQNGTRISTVFNGIKKAGFHKMQFHLDKLTSQTIKTGFYILNLKNNGRQQSLKVFIAQ